MSFDPQQNSSSNTRHPSSGHGQMSIPRSGVSRPAWLTRENKQLAVLVRDCSGSMSGQKATDATAASLGLINELAQPENRDGFEVAVVNFESSGRLEHDVTPATALAEHVNPVYGGGGTNMATGLEIAFEVISRAKFQASSYLRPVVVAFSDGQTSGQDATRLVATKLKSSADLVTVAFGADADESFLREIATSPDHFYRCSDGKSLRAFFAAVGATMCVSLQRGQNATIALSQVRF